MCGSGGAVHENLDARARPAFRISKRRSGLGGNGAQGIRQSGRVARVDCGTGGNLRDGGIVRCDHRAAALHRLQNRQTEALVMRGVDESESVRIEAREFGIGDFTQQPQTRFFGERERNPRAFFRR